MQYLALNKLQAKYKKYGFNVLGFPCNQFGYQEPSETPEELLNGLRYVRPGSDFVPNFQLFEMTEVNGERSSGLYDYLKSTCEPPMKSYRKQIDLEYAPLHGSDVRWNFEKFLIARNGRAVMRIQHTTEPDELIPFIEALLNNCSFEHLKHISKMMIDCQR